MKFALILTFVLLSTFQVYSQTQRLVDTERKTLEDFLGTEIAEDECRTEEIIYAEQDRLTIWINVLSNPQLLRDDIAILDEVYALIERAKASIQGSYDDFEAQTEEPVLEGDPLVSSQESSAEEGTELTVSVFTQIKSFKQAFQEFKVAHSLYQDEMTKIMAQIEAFSNQDGSEEELVGLADQILTAILNLQQSIQSLLADEANFAGYVDVLNDRSLSNSLEVVRCYTENTEGFSDGFSGFVDDDSDNNNDGQVPQSVTVGGGDGDNQDGGDGDNQDGGDGDNQDGGDGDNQDGGDGDNQDGGDDQGQEIRNIITPNGGGDSGTDNSNSGSNLTQSDFTVKSGELSGPALQSEVLVATKKAKKHHHHHKKEKKHNKSKHQKAHAEAVEKLKKTQDNKKEKKHDKNLRHQKKNKKSF